ncbi:MAG TPA: replicative DNA helicase [Symbiobacteriaceae bacterium]|jgi:replicative DNA helicase|nr:replicative DNA helicase [Symbiobacteriaceae bacterium]
MNAFSERVPPQNLEAEQSVLGAMLIDRDAVVSVTNLLMPEDFYADKHQALYAAIHSIFGRGEPVDLITVQDELRKRGQLDDVGGLVYLTSLVNLVPSTANVQQYATIVQQKASLRRLQTVARKIVDDCYATEDIEATMQEAEKSVFSVTQRRSAKGYVHIKDALVTAYGHLEFLYSSKGRTTGVTTGFRDLDQMTSGLQPSDMIIIAARPSVGKTAFTLNVARNAAILGGAKVMFFSLEMGAEQLALRLLAAEAAVDGHKLRTGQLQDQDWARLGTGLATLAESGIFIDDTPNCPLPDLRAKARRVAAEHGLDLIMIDYLQLMSIPQRPGAQQNRQQEISEISRSLKQLARELKVPVIALSQLSRSVEQRQDKRPMLSDLRESGAIEQDADMVAFLYRDDYYDPESEKKNMVEVIVAKHRNGPVGSVDLYFMKDIQKMVGMEHKRGA